MKLRKEINKIKRIVVKIGSSVLTDPNGKIDDDYVSAVCADITSLCEQNIEVILVSSGAIQAGSYILNEFDRNKVSHLQSASSIGQPMLFGKYSEALSNNSINSAQILVTHDDFKARNRFLNIRNTLLHLLQNNIIPIINENDTVSFKEITVGDNDHLAVMIAQSISADLLLLITSADGLYDQDPNNSKAKLIRTVPYDFDFSSIQVGSISASGRGGMESKINAARKATSFGMNCIVAGKHSQPIINSLENKIGTFFESNPEKINDKKAWLISTARPDCHVEIDSGCSKALLSGASLLPAGITDVSGDFTRGDCISIYSEGKILAVGLTEYSSKEIKGIKGLKTTEISVKLGFCISDEVIHRDNLKLTEND